MDADNGGRPHEDGLAVLQELLLGTDTLQDFLGEVAAAAASEFDTGVACGVTVRTHARRPTTLGASDAFAAALDETQYAEGQGPCLHALNTGEVVAIPDIAKDERWPRFTERSAAQGAGSSLSMPMRTAQTGVIGALNLYARDAHAFADADRDRAGRFADLAAGAVAIGVRLAQRTELSEDLRVALSSRSTIDQALGIIMGQRRCDADEAFSVLRQLSQTGNAKLRDIAAQVIFTVTGAPPAPPATVSRPVSPLPSHQVGQVPRHRPDPGPVGQTSADGTSHTRSPRALDVVRRPGAGEEDGVAAYRRSLIRHRGRPVIANPLSCPGTTSPLPRRPGRHRPSSKSIRPPVVDDVRK